MIASRRLLATGFLLVSVIASGATAPALPASSPEFFESRVRPILANNCYGCHTTSKLGGLRVASREALVQGGASGTSLLPGDPDSSLVIKAVLQMGELKMPKGGKLKQNEIDDLVAWVKAGAIWPASPNAPVVQAKGGTYVITPEQRAFWSFQPLRSTTP